MNSRFSLSRTEHAGPFSDPGRWLRAFADLITGTPRWRKVRRTRRVRWIEGTTPDSDEAAAIREALTTHGCDTYEAVTRRAAELLFRRDFAAGGWLAGIGLVLPSYLSLVRQTLERVRGRLVSIEDEDTPWS
jgi:hypothetical protein